MEREMSTITLNVPEISCGHCRAAITSEVSTVAGVESVIVNLDAKMVTVTGEPLDEAAVVAAIDEAGYEVAASR
jgi:copper chaperone